MSVSSGYDVVHSADEAAAIKQSATHGPATWHANLWADVPTAINYANENPVSLPGSIVFNIRDNGQVWTYDFRP